MSRRRLRLPLSAVIGSQFVLIICCLGGVMMWLSWRGTTRLLGRLSASAVDSAAEAAQRAVSDGYAPVRQTVNLLCRTGLPDAATPEAREAYLPLLTQALLNEPKMASVFVGYADGDFFIARRLSSPAVRRDLEVPPEAVWAYDHIDGAQTPPILTRRFLNEDLTLQPQTHTEATPYDPRTRSWFEGGMAVEGVYFTAPYPFFFYRSPGVTIARAATSRRAVIGADITLSQISATLAAHLPTGGSRVVLLTPADTVLGSSRAEQIWVQEDRKTLRLKRLNELDDPVMAGLAAAHPGTAIPERFSLRIEGELWQGSTRDIPVARGDPLRLVVLSPRHELMADAVRLRARFVWVTLGMLLVVIPIVWSVARKLTRPLRQLTLEAERMQTFDFEGESETVYSVVEIERLGYTLRLMRQTIRRFMRLIHALAGETDFDRLLQHVTRETLSATRSEAAAAFLWDEAHTRLEPKVAVSAHRETVAIEELESQPADSDSPIAQACRSGELQTRAVDVKTLGLADALGLPAADSGHLLIVIPLVDRSDACVGALCLLARAEGDRNEAQIAFAAALSGFAAVSLESRDLLQRQKALLDAFIRILADAIDAKSRYTGGHCQRVPVLGEMLAEAAHVSSAPAFSAFELDDQRREALHIAGWLHDCGKVTTPTYVVDKATKLETIYNRIHEIRTRFELLKRDAQLRYWRKLSGAEHGDADPPVGPDGESLARELSELDEQFAFVAECNMGGEFMSDERIERLERIAGRTWQRTLDDRLGLSADELARYPSGAAELPVTERLLDDKPHHRVAREPDDPVVNDPEKRFSMSVPELKYNRGELYNLSVARGTLTTEERYKINEHVVQSILMLDQLPYPEHLKSIPRVAGSHHEHLDGSGYPSGLTADDLPLEGRILAIADVFEALTSSDRPYKRMKTLEQALGIMQRMVDDNHLDRDLFELFVADGVHLDYARRFLKPEQYP